MALSERHMKGLESRKIDIEVATRMGLYSAKRLPDSSVVRDLSGEILCFPYFEDGVEVNTKYRAYSNGQRRMWQRSKEQGAVKTPYNIDVVLNDETRAELEADDTHALVVTEGEFDCIAAIQSGYPHSISLPEGAVADKDQFGRSLPPVPDNVKDIVPGDDDKFSFFARHFEKLSLVRNFIICTDDDGPGRRMAQEMVRRIGAARCLQVHYPKGDVVPDPKLPRDVDGAVRLRSCKDLNEVLIHFGPDAVRHMLDNASPWPVKGLYKLSDYPDTEMPETFETGISKELDRSFRLYESCFAVVTGPPGFGKSTLVNQIAVQMAKLHRWPVCIFSGEMPTKPYLSTPLMTAFLNKPRSEWSADDRRLATDFVERYFSFIDYNVRPEEDEAEIDVEFIIQKGTDACFRYGTRLLILDPWNEIEHGARPMNISQTEYIGNAIRKLKRFAKSCGCAVIVIAHPRKLSGGEEVSLYSIADSAAFANKAELGMVITGEDLKFPWRDVGVKKVKFEGTGEVSDFRLTWDAKTRLFVRYDPMGAVAATTIKIDRS